MQILKFVKKEVPQYATGEVSTPAGNVFRVLSDWSRADNWGMIKSRIGAFRMNYAVSPGLSAVGEPMEDSDVFVSANYKLSFDILRRELKGLNAWGYSCSTPKALTSGAPRAKGLSAQMS